MSKILLVEKTNLVGSRSWVITDEDDKVLSGKFGFRQDAERDFEKMKDNIVKNGGLASSKILQEFSYDK